MSGIAKGCLQFVICRQQRWPADPIRNKPVPQRGGVNPVRLAILIFSGFGVGSCHESMRLPLINGITTRGFRLVMPAGPMRAGRSCDYLRPRGLNRPGRGRSGLCRTFRSQIRRSFRGISHRGAQRFRRRTTIESSFENAALKKETGFWKMTLQFCERFVLAYPVCPAAVKPDNPRHGQLTLAVVISLPISTASRSGLHLLVWNPLFSVPRETASVNPPTADHRLA